MFGSEPDKYRTSTARVPDKIDGKSLPAPWVLLDWLLPIAETLLISCELAIVEELIAAILNDISQKGFSSVMPFSIGSVEIRMSQFAAANGIELASNELYMSAKQLQHSMRTSKYAKGLVVDASELIAFPQNRFSMELYYDGECFIYTDGLSKFIVHPNYKMKISRELVAKVNFITATKVKDPAEFTLPKYREI